MIKFITSMNKLLKHQPGSSVVISQATKCKQIHYIIIKPLALFSVPHTNTFNNWIKHWISLCQFKHVMPGFLGTIVHNCITTSLDTTFMQCTYTDSLQNVIFIMFYGYTNIVLINCMPVVMTGLCQEVVILLKW